MALLAGLTETDQALLDRVNRAGLAALRECLDSGRAVAFLGAGASAPLYPLWAGVISELLDVARDRLNDQAIGTCQAMTDSNPDAVVEIVRRHLGSASFREVLRQVFRGRRDPATGRTWTPMQELVARCGFAGVITTNYDPGIVNARMAVRPYATGTGFASWTDEDALDRWRTGDVFGNDELPVLYAHGHHNQPDAIVLATSDYRRAYGGKLGAVLRALVDVGHLVWIGFSFTDQRIGAVLREVGEGAGPQREPGVAPRHVALLPWNPSPDRVGGGEPYDPEIIRSVMEIQYGCHTVLYPAQGTDHSALSALLEAFTQTRFPATGTGRDGLNHPAASGESQVPLSTGGRPGDGVTGPVAATRGPVSRWVHGGVPIDHFIGREEELARLNRWAADPEVRLIGVTAWGGAGKTALVTEWLNRQHLLRPVRGVFAWSFYENPSIEAWAADLLAWGEEVFRYSSGKMRRPSVRVLDLTRRMPLLLVLDGLEAIQEVPSRQDFGRFLDDLLRVVLTGLCQRDHAGLVVLTSRFPFADLESFDGAAARMLDVPPFTAAEGAELLAKAGGQWLPELQRRDLVRAMDGHALAVSALATTLRERPPVSDLARLRDDLTTAGRTDARVGRVLQFYAERLSMADCLLVALVSLFARPVPATTVLSLGDSETLGRPFAEWTSTQVETAARGPLAGLLTWHPDGSISAHPLVRDTFRAMVLTGDTAQRVSAVALADLPQEQVVSHDEALRVIEMIELLLDAGQWETADRLQRGFVDNGRLWTRLPAARLGQRCASAFVATEERRRACRERLSAEHLARFLNWEGLCAMLAGDMTAAESSLKAAFDHYCEGNDRSAQSLALQRLSGCLCYLGQATRAREAAEKSLDLAPNGSFTLVRNAITTLAAALDLAGRTSEADEWFTKADLTQVSHGSRDHLYSLGGTLWADLLLRTGRATVARQLTERNYVICENNHWNHGIARANRLLARCDLADGDLLSAGSRLDQAASTFRDGDFVVELASTLPDVAEHRRQSGDLGSAEQLCRETINLAGSRQLVPSHALALSIRAKARADRYVATNDTSAKDRARDDADHALRLATKIRLLPWQELGALEAHAHIDRLEGHDRGWGQKAQDLRAMLIPDLHSDPLAPVDNADGQ